MKKFIRTTNSSVAACELADYLKVEYNIDSEFGDNGIYVEEKNYDIADSVLADMEIENEINQEDLEEEDEK